VCMGRILPKDSQLMFPKSSGAINCIAVVIPNRVAMTIQKADVRQNPRAVLCSSGKVFVDEAIKGGSPYRLLPFSQ
jgi:hypothetical protein